MLRNRCSRLGDDEPRDVLSMRGELLPDIEGHGPRAARASRPGGAVLDAREHTDFLREVGGCTVLKIHNESHAQSSWRISRGRELRRTRTHARWSRKTPAPAGAPTQVESFIQGGSSSPRGGGWTFVCVPGIWRIAVCTDFVRTAKANSK